MPRVWQSVHMPRDSWKEQKADINPWMPGILAEDTGRQTLYPVFKAASTPFRATAKPKAKSKAAAKRLKEASQMEIRQLAKQFGKAKSDECKSWVEKEVYQLVDMRKINVKNFVTGRWVLTVKRNKDGTFDKCKA